MLGLVLFLMLDMRWLWIVLSLCMRYSNTGIFCFCVWLCTLVELLCRLLQEVQKCAKFFRRFFLSFFLLFFYLAKRLLHLLCLWLVNMWKRFVLSFLTYYYNPISFLISLWALLIFWNSVRSPPRSGWCFLANFL